MFYFISVSIFYQKLATSTQIEVIRNTSTEYISLLFRSTFLNEPIKRMLFAMFSYIFTLVPICLLRHHPRYEHFVLYPRKKGFAELKILLLK